MNGIINVLKPPGMTSQNVVSAMRRATGIKRIGHSGTLDPYAAGVLPIFIGKATRVVEYSLAGEKEYIGEICFGIATDTLDAQGKIVGKNDVCISENQFKGVLSQTTGEILQIPPMYSALKRNGEKLVNMARKGKTIEIAARPVQIAETEYLGQQGVNRFLFRVKCSKGTYIRSLCDDWGKALDTVAHLCFLLRTKTGNFDIEHSFSLEEIEDLNHKSQLESALLPISSAVTNLSVIQLEVAAKEAVLFGQPIADAWIISLPEEYNQPAQLWVGNSFFGIAKRTEAGVVTIKVIWEEPCTR